MSRPRTGHKGTPNQALQQTAGHDSFLRPIAQRAPPLLSFVVRLARASRVEVVVLNQPDGAILARGSYYGGPDYEFVVAADGHVDWRVVGNTESVWAGPDAESFRRIAAAWNRYRAEYRPGLSGAAEQEFFAQMRREFEELGALPTDLPSDPEPLWSLLLFEAENGLA